MKLHWKTAPYQVTSGRTVGFLCGRVGLKISTLAGIDTDITLLFQSWDKSIINVVPKLVVTSVFLFSFSPWLKILSLCSNSVIIIITKRPLLQEGCWLLRHSPTNPLVFTSYLQQKALRLNPSPLFLVPVLFFFWNFLEFSFLNFPAFCSDKQEILSTFILRFVLFCFCF